MALGKATFNNLKEGPKEDKVVVASGIAISVVVILLVCWGIYFFHNIRSGAQSTSLTGGAQDRFNFENVTAAQQDLQTQLNGDTSSEYEDIRRQNASGNSQMQMQTQTVDDSGSNQFNPTQ